MPTKLAAISEGVANRAADVGEQIRAHRKSLKVSATTAAEAAGMSRVTWYRIEKRCNLSYLWCTSKCVDRIRA